MKEKSVEVFETFGNKKLRISEIFSSVQGEGVYLGTPAVFLRLAICNLQCWYCDTKYTWLYHKKALEQVQLELETLQVKPPTDLRVYDYSNEIKDMDCDDVIRQILNYKIKHLVVTGGEPMLQKDSLVPVLASLKQKQFFIEVETNGTINPSSDIIPLVDQWNVSPKLSSSGNGSSIRLKDEALLSFRRLPNAFFKFVVESLPDLEEIETLVRRYAIDRDRVILMPQGTTPELLKEKSGFIVRVCKENGFRFTPRLHILLFGNKRGT